ncbi:microsomal glutathione S-transferase 1 [Cephus cinctus]|uniref:Microsomal glutathione S-transferase 1 n=1 Tax=Cephus cinctus TaxID=211228 RepID=A0AAJ7BGX3_CEPCN|nr:microsomal glutathione S-transferase 1 [Cephus cinctus]
MAIEIDPQLFGVFAFWSGILILKIMSMALLTAKQRFAKKVFANSEDLMNKSDAKVKYDDPDVERVRRAHQNDLENILPWFLITFIWLQTGPSVWLATQLIRAFAISRCTHSLFYAVVPKQPHRALSFFVGYWIMFYEAVSVILHFL